MIKSVNAELLTQERFSLARFPISVIILAETSNLRLENPPERPVECYVSSVQLLESKEMLSVSWLRIFFVGGKLFTLMRSYLLVFGLIL